MANTTHRFAEDTVDSHQAWLWVTSILALSYSVLVLIIRGFVKWRVYDTCDTVLLIAYALSFAMHILMFIGLKQGLGKAAYLLTQERNEYLARLVFTSRVLLPLALGLSKVSVLLFVQRLFTPDSKGPWLTLKCAIYGILLWTFLAPVVQSGWCNPNLYLVAKLDVACGIKQQSRFITVAIMESLTELVTVMLPIYLSTRIRLQREYKVLTFVGFGFRLSILPIGSLYGFTYFQFLTSGEDNIGVIKNLVLQEAFIAYSLILATIPCLRTFVRRFRTGGIRRLLDDGTRTFAPGGTSTKAAAATALRSMATQIRNLGAYSIFDTFAKRSEGRQHLAFRPDLENQHWASVFRGPPASRTVDTASDVIETTTTWDVQFQTAEGWEKRRAEQILSAPRRTSAASVNFITTAQW